jgi:hypothetical protein
VIQFTAARLREAVVVLITMIRSSHGVQPSPTLASLHTCLNVFRTFAASSAAPRSVAYTSPVPCHL